MAGGNKTRRPGEGAVAIMASRYGIEKVAAYLTYGERQDKANKAEADLLAMLAAEEDGDSKKKQHHQGRQRNKGKGKKKTGQEEQNAAGFNGKGYDAQRMDGRKTEDEPREAEQEEQDSGKPGAYDTVTAGLLELTFCGSEHQKNDEADEHAFLLLDAPEDFVCPLTHELLIDPVVAACGYSYQRKSFEEWVAKCRAKGLQLTSPKTGARMEGHMVTNRLLKHQVEDYIEARREAWRQRGEGARAAAAGGGREE
jgi:hypothetical protein